MQRYLYTVIGMAALCAGGCSADGSQGALDGAEEPVDVAAQELTGIVPVHALPPVSATRYCANARLLVTGYFDSDPQNGQRRGYRGGVTVVEGGPATLQHIHVVETVKGRGSADGDYKFGTTVRAGSVYVGQHQGTSRDTTLWASRANVSLSVSYDLATPNGIVSCSAVPFASP
jgi:hypothetical protein